MKDISGKSPWTSRKQVTCRSISSWSGACSGRALFLSHPERALWKRQVGYPSSAAGSVPHLPPPAVLPPDFLASPSPPQPDPLVPAVLAPCSLHRPQPPFHSPLQPLPPPGSVLPAPQEKAPGHRAAAMTSAGVTALLSKPDPVLLGGLCLSPPF